MQKIEGNTIKVNRGDELIINFAINYEDGSKYIFQEGDTLIFALYNKGCLDKKAVLLKTITPEANAQSVEIELTSTDTQLGNILNQPKEYWYEIELNGEHTILGYDDNGAKLFILYPEGSKLV